MYRARTVIIWCARTVIVCRVVQNDDPMHMIGHHDERTQFNVGEMFGDLAPTFVCNPTKIR
jgi:hypothetical protein